MGGDLHQGPAGKSLTFLVAALKDPIGANLDRIRVVKGWMDARGELHEKVFDVACSNDRKPDPTTGKVPTVGSTVDVRAYTSPIWYTPNRAAGSAGSGPLTLFMFAFVRCRRCSLAEGRRCTTRPG
jgi:hypothetical protein